jgi:hypothetical protein
VTNEEGELGRVNGLAMFHQSAYLVMYSIDRDYSNVDVYGGVKLVNTTNHATADETTNLFQTRVNAPFYDVGLGHYDSRSTTLSVYNRTDMAISILKRELYIIEWRD